MVLYLDQFLLIVCGGIPWQPYYQRALSVQSSRQAKILSVSATFLSLFVMIPPMLLGGAAKSMPAAAAAAAGTNGTLFPDATIVLPAMIYYQTPGWVRYISLAAIRSA